MQNTTPQHTRTLNETELKKEAQEYKQNNSGVKHGQALNHIAKQHGFKNWNAIKKHIEYEEGICEYNDILNEDRLILEVVAFDDYSERGDKLYLLPDGRYGAECSFGTFYTGVDFGGDTFDLMDLLFYMIYSEEAHTRINVKKVRYASDKMEEILVSLREEDMEPHTEGILDAAEMLLFYKDRIFLENNCGNSYEEDEFYLLRETVLDIHNIDLVKVDVSVLEDYKNTTESYVISGRHTMKDGTSTPNIAIFENRKELTRDSIDDFIEFIHLEMEEEIDTYPVIKKFSETGKGNADKIRNIALNLGHTDYNSLIEKVEKLQNGQFKEGLEEYLTKKGL